MCRTFPVIGCVTVTCQQCCGAFVLLRWVGLHVVQKLAHVFLMGPSVLLHNSLTNKPYGTHP